MDARNGVDPMTKLSELRGLCLHIMCYPDGCHRVLARRVEDFIEKVGDIELEELAPRMCCTKCGRHSPTLSPWTGGPFSALRDNVFDPKPW